MRQQARHSRWISIYSSTHRPTGDASWSPARRRGDARAGIIEMAVAIDGDCATARAVTCGAFRPRDTIDAGGRAVVPGFVDPHTHLRGRRRALIRMRIGGATYMQIMAAAAGSLAPWRTRAPHRWRPCRRDARPLDRMLAHARRPRGQDRLRLNVPDELKQLDAIVELRGRTRSISAHVSGRARRAAEYRGDRAYVDLVVGEMLPRSGSTGRRWDITTNPTDLPNHRARFDKSSDSLSSSVRAWPISATSFARWRVRLPIAAHLEAAQRLGLAEAPCG